jgi:hypothetical protein
VPTLRRNAHLCTAQYLGQLGGGGSRVGGVS